MGRVRLAGTASAPSRGIRGPVAFAIDKDKIKYFSTGNSGVSRKKRQRVINQVSF
jgi:hypothetical protein